MTHHCVFCILGHTQDERTKMFTLPMEDSPIHEGISQDIPDHVLDAIDQWIQEEPMTERRMTSCQ